MSEAIPVHLYEALEGLAENPALPAEMVWRLLGSTHGFGQVAKRADLTDDVITEIIKRGDHWQVHSLALNRKLPNAFRLRLAAHRDASIRAALVIGAVDGSRDLFERLITDTDLRVRKHLAESESVPADLRARLVDDPDPDVRAALARHWTQAPQGVRRALLTDPEQDVRAAACSIYYASTPHPIPPVDLIPALLADPATRVGVVRHLELDPKTAIRLAADPSYEVRRELAKHPQLPSYVRDQLADDPSAAVKVAIFARTDTPEPIRHRLHAEITENAPHLADPLPDDLDDEAIVQQIEDSLARFELEELRLDWVTADPMPHLSSPYGCFRASAARSDSLPPEAVALLLNDEENSIRIAAATTAPHLVDAVIAERIDRDFGPNRKTNWRPADTLPLPPQTLRRLATDPDPRMRCLAPRDPSLPAELAEQLARDPESSVRRAIVQHPNLPEHSLLALISDDSKWVAKTAAASPFLPIGQMDRLLTLAGL